MTEETKRRMRAAYTNAAEMIRGHAEVGLEPEDVNEINEEGLVKYSKACDKVAKKLDKLAEKYK